MIEAHQFDLLSVKVIDFIVEINLALIRLMRVCPK